jgi:sugar lactone lactonase YvrE
MKHALVILLASAVAACGEVQYAFTNFAGMPGGLGTADGTGSAGRFSHPRGVAVDIAGNLYVADNANHTIRKITPAGEVMTLAGSARQSGSTDGTGSAARFNGPLDVAVDSAGYVYVADFWNVTIRKITPAGEVTTLAGSDHQSGSADGTGSAARFLAPTGVAVDNANNVYVADALNSTIRKITPAGAVTTLAGSAGQVGSTDGTGSEARFSGPRDMEADSARNVYVADGNYTIRKITPAGVVTTLAGSAGQSGSVDGTGSAARFLAPYGMAVDDAGNVYVADVWNYTIRKITPAGLVTTLAGSAGQFGSADGTGSAARFYGPFGVAADSAGNVYVADSENNTIRKITPAGVVSALAGSAEQSGSSDGTGITARFNFPFGVAVDRAGNVFVSDAYNLTIRKITPAGDVTTLAGSVGQSGNADGAGGAARFQRSPIGLVGGGGPFGLAVDSAGNVYAADSGNHTIRKITATGEVTTLAGSAGQAGILDGTGSAARFYRPHGVAVDSPGNVFVADTYNGTIRKITPGGKVTTLTDKSGDGLAVDSAGNLYVTESWNSTIWKITPSGEVTTLAGSAGQIGGADGIGSAAHFSQPHGIAVDSTGNLYVADSGNNRITKGTPLPGSPSVQFVAGSMTVSDGVFRMQLTGPSGSNSVLEASANLQAWTPVQTNLLPPDGLNWSLPLNSAQNQFFRARLAP